MLDSHFPRADCHCHTLFSDGTLSPVALLELAKRQSLTGLSITDHDTVEAYETALPFAQTLGIEMVSGVEISAEFRNVSIHVLGYAFDLHHPGLLQFCKELQHTREQRNLEILHKLAKLEMPIALDEIKAVFPHGTIGRPHIAKMMVSKGYVKTAEKAFDKYLGNNCRAYVKGALFEVEEAIELIHQAGGYAVIAHPHFIKPKSLMTALSDMPFDGIEAYYGRLSLSQEQPWIRLAHQKNWLVTGGSDYHGETKSHAILGSAWTPEDNFALFKKRFAEHKESV
jgi:3',5'-nucleoside bisphosphate phosphatase